MAVRNEAFLEMANRIGFGLCRDAIWHDNLCTWAGWAIVPLEQAWPTVYRTLEADLYGGTSGIALFLAELYRFNRDRQCARAIEGAVRQMQMVSDANLSTRTYGLYSGHAGIAFVLIALGRLMEREDWLVRGLQLMSSVCTLPPDRRFVDVVNGSAGLIPALLRLAKQFHRQDFLECAIKHGQHLLEVADRRDGLCSWQTTQTPGQSHLTGYSHGASGIATAMLELAHATGEKQWQDYALEGLAYERQLFNAQCGNWEDLRIMPGQTPETKKEHPPAYFMAWCHGAPGIGMSRLRNSVLLPEDAANWADLEVALATTVASLSPTWTPRQGNYSLCHGAAGNAELLVMAGRQLGRAALIQLAEKVGEAGIDFHVNQGLPWPCGNGGAGETPNLMLGTAGIGHFYLRLYDAKLVPSVLLISPE